MEHRQTRFIDLSHAIEDGMIANTSSYVEAPFHRFAAVPPKVKEMGTFPVRSYAVID